MNIDEWLRRAQAALTESGCPDPEIDARWMAEDVLGMTRAEMKFEGEREVRPAELQTLDAMLARRAAGEPVQYILEPADFMGLQILRGPPGADSPAGHRDAGGARADRGLRAARAPGARSVHRLRLHRSEPEDPRPGAEVTLADVSRDALDVAEFSPGAAGRGGGFATATCTGPWGPDRFDLIVSIRPTSPHGLVRTFSGRCATSLCWPSTAALTGWNSTVASRRGPPAPGPWARRSIWSVDMGQGQTVLHAENFCEIRPRLRRLGHHRGSERH